MISEVIMMAVAAAALSVSAASGELAPQNCAATAFRVYFEPGATQLNDDAEALIGVAAREVAGCADVDVTMTPAANPGSSANLARSMAIAVAMREHGIETDVAMPHMARYAAPARAASPAYIEVRMTPAVGISS